MKLKRTVAFILAVIMTAVMIPTVNVSAAKEGKITYHIVDGCAVIVAYDSALTGTLIDPVVRIPETLGGYPVTEIGESAFQGCNNFYNIVLPDSITKIGAAAFKGCSMKGITLPANLTAIADETFSSCSNLLSIVIPEGVTSIGNRAFYSCSGLTAISFPDGVKTIGDEAFRYCSNIGAAVLPEGLESLGSYPFRDCYNINRVVLPDCVTELADNYFDRCVYLRKVELSDKVTKIGKDVFKGTRLESFTMPLGITEVDDYMFNFCEYLATVELHDGVTRIGEGAFNHCYSLKDLYIPASVTEIGKTPFGYTVIENFEVDENNPVYSTVDGLLTTKDGKTMLSYPAGNPRTEYTVPEGIDTVGDSAFYCVRNLHSVTVPAGVTKIGYGAFIGCSNLTEITVASTVSDIGDELFRGMKPATDGALIIYGDRGSAIEEYASREGVTFIALDEITDEDRKFLYSMDNGFIVINGYTGEYPDDFVIPDEIGGYFVYRIEEYAFENATFKTVTLPKNLREIGEYAFHECAALEEINLPDGLDKIEEAAFVGCSSLKGIVIPDSITRLEDSTFIRCSSLGEVKVPDSVTYIHSYAFLGCNMLSFYCNTGSYAENYAKLLEIPYRTSESEPVPTPEVYDRGDVDQNNKVNLTDASLVLKYVAGWSFYFEDKDADVNGDGSINLSDVSLLLKYIAGWDVQFAPLSENE